MEVDESRSPSASATSVSSAESHGLARQRVGGGVAAGTHLGEHARSARVAAPAAFASLASRPTTLSPWWKASTCEQIAQTRAQIDHGARRRVSAHPRARCTAPAANTRAASLGPMLRRVRHLLQEPSIDGMNPPQFRAVGPRRRAPPRRAREARQASAAAAAAQSAIGVSSSPPQLEKRAAPALRQPRKKVVGDKIEGGDARVQQPVVSTQQRERAQRLGAERVDLGRLHVRTRSHAPRATARRDPHVDLRREFLPADEGRRPSIGRPRCARCAIPRDARADGNHRTADRRLLARGGGNRRRLLARGGRLCGGRRSHHCWRPSTSPRAWVRVLRPARPDPPVVRTASPLGLGGGAAPPPPAGGGESKAGGWGKAVHLLHVFLWLASLPAAVPAARAPAPGRSTSPPSTSTTRARTAAGLVVDSLARRRARLRGTGRRRSSASTGIASSSTSASGTSWPNPGRHEPTRPLQPAARPVGLPQRQRWRAPLGAWRQPP